MRRYTDADDPLSSGEFNMLGEIKNSMVGQGGAAAPRREVHGAYYFSLSYVFQWSVMHEARSIPFFIRQTK